jgi:hypothetical protein
MSSSGGPAVARAAATTGGKRSRLAALPWFLLSFAVFAGVWFISRLLSYKDLAAVLGAVLGVTLFAFVSFRWPQFPVVLWFLSLMGFRELVFVPTPGLPDITLDRLMMMWSGGVFILRTIVTRRRLPGPYLLDILIAVHGLYLLGSALITHPGAVNGWSRSCLMAYSAYYLAKYLFTDLKWIRTIFIVLFLMNIYNGITSIAEHMHWDFLVWPKNILDRTQGMQVAGRSRGIFLQSAVLGTVMGMVLTVNYYYMRLARGAFARIVTYGGFAVAVLGLYYTYTRGTWICAASAILALTIFGARTYARQTVGLALAGVLLLGLGFLNLGGDRFLRERMGAENTVTGRISTLSNAFRMFRDRPIFGVGYFNYMKNIPDYRGTVNVPIFGVIKQGEGDVASIHDIFLGALAETGIVGFGLQLGIYATLASAVLRRRRRGRENSHYEVFVLPVLVSMLIAYLFGGLSFDYRYFETINSLGFFVAGILYQYVTRGEDELLPGAASAPSRDRFFVRVDPR